MKKDINLKIHDLFHEHKTHHAKAGGTLKIGGSVKPIQNPGDMTVNYLLAFLALFLSPILALVTTSEYYSVLSPMLRIISLIAVVVLSFLLVLKTSTGIKLVQSIVQYIKRTEVK